jgi:hypothetical protein
MCNYSFYHPEERGYASDAACTKVLNYQTGSPNSLPTVSITKTWILFRKADTFLLGLSSPSQTMASLLSQLLWRGLVTRPETDSLIAIQNDGQMSILPLFDTTSIPSQVAHKPQVISTRRPLMNRIVPTNSPTS